MSRACKHGHVGGFRGLPCYQCRAEHWEAEAKRLKAQIDTPHTENFFLAVKLEAAHQRERWGSDHDEGKTPEDWLWLIAYLSTKASQASRYKDKEKYFHHIITCAAACANWYANATGVDEKMRPGVRLKA